LFEAAYKNDPAAEKRFCAFGICDTDAVVSAETILHGSVAAVPASFLIDALKRDVNNPERWCDTGEAMLRAGRLDAAGTCFANALALGHDDPPVLLRSAFYFFDWHQNERALELTARVLRNTSTYDGQVFEAYRKNQVPGAEVLKYGLPRMQRAYESYVRWVMEDGQVEGAMAAWQDAARQGFAGSALANEYVQFLVNHQRPELAAEAWARYAGARRNGYLQSTWVYNGDFEFDPSGSALDWSIEPVAGIDMGVDGSEAHSGSRSLRVHFGGQDNVEFRHITERAYVTPGVYRFVAYVRTDHLTTDQGLSFHVFDPASGSRLDVRTEQVNGTNDWTKLEQSFCVGRQTKLIEVQVVRPASWKFDNKISGTAWIDSVSLVKVGGECRERASGATAVLDAR
jgi:tetratricopeptide (TPR) repeat protein